MLFDLFGCLLGCFVLVGFFGFGGWLNVLFGFGLLVVAILFLF